MKNPPAFSRKPVRDVLNQHVDDAAFLWSHRSENLWSPRFFQADQDRLDSLLDAHLEGIRFAKHHALERALKNLGRWQSPGEAFVLSYTSLHIDDENALQQLEEQVEEMPLLAEGVAASLLWSHSDAAKSAIDRWMFGESPPLRQAAVPAALIHPDLDREKFIRRCIEDAFPGIRLRAYRAIGEWQMREFIDSLKKGAQDSSVFCRAEAAASLALLGDSSALSHLPPIFHYFEKSRLRRYLLIWSMLSTHQEFDDWFKQHRGQEAHYRNLIWALTFRGDALHLPRLRAFLAQGIETTLTAYAISHITGIEIEDELLAPPRDDEEHTPHSDDAGLPEPNVDALLSRLDAQPSSFPDAQCIANGVVLSDALDTLLNTGNQPQRWQAALALTLQGRAGVMPSLLQPRLPSL